MGVLHHGIHTGFEVYSNYESCRFITLGQISIDRNISVQRGGRKTILAAEVAGTTLARYRTDAADHLWIRSFYLPTSESSYNYSTLTKLNICLWVAMPSVITFTHEPQQIWTFGWRQILRMWQR